MAASGRMVGDAARHARRAAAARAVQRRPPPQPGPGRHAAGRHRRDALRHGVAAACGAAAPAGCLPASLVGAGERVDAHRRLGGGGGAGGRAGPDPGAGRACRFRARRRPRGRRRRAALRGGRGLVRWPRPAGGLRAAACGRGVAAGGAPLLVGGVHGDGGHRRQRDGAGLAAARKPAGPWPDRVRPPAGGQGRGVPAPHRGRRPEPGAGPAQNDGKGPGRRGSRPPCGGCRAA